MSSSKKRWEDFYLHLILICVKCTIFLLEKSSFFLLSPALVPLLSSYMKILILRLSFRLSRCQSFLQTPYIKSGTFYLPLDVKGEKEMRRKTRLISHQIVYKKGAKTVTDILQFADAPASLFILSRFSRAIFYSKSNRIRCGGWFCWHFL